MSALSWRAAELSSSQAAPGKLQCTQSPPAVQQAVELWATGNECSNPSPTHTCEQGPVWAMTPVGLHMQHV